MVAIIMKVTSKLNTTEKTITIKGKMLEELREVIKRKEEELI